MKPYKLMLGLVIATMPAWAADEPLRLWYDRPATKWEEANPIGNGRFGAMVFGGLETERLQLNEDTLYSGYPGHRDLPRRIPEHFSAITNLLAQRRFTEAEAIINEKWLGAAQACFQPLGDLYLEFSNAAGASNYVRELDLASATWRARYEVAGVQYTRAVFASAPDQAIVIRLAANRSGKMNFRVRFNSPHPTAAVQANAAGRLALHGQVPGFTLRRDLALVEKKREMWKYPQVWDASGQRQPGANTVIYDGKGMFFDTRLAVRATGGQITTETNSLVIAGADEAVIICTAASSFNGFDRDPVRQGVDAAAKAEKWLEAAAGRSFEALRERHVRDYRELFGRVTLSLGSPNDQSRLPTDQRIKQFASGQDPALAALYFQFGRYLLISGSRPGTQPLNLQGIWNPHVIPPWAGAYTVNINAEMNYWAAEPANLSECHEPLLRMVRELSVDGARVAKKMYARRGWVAHHNTTIWRDAQPVDGNAVAAYWPMAAPWLCQHLFEHYQFTGDRQFLREVYPVLKGASEFLLDWLVEDRQDRLVTPVSTSPENAFTYTDASGKRQRAAVSPGCTADLALARDLLNNTRRAAEVLNRDAAFQRTLQSALARIHPYQIAANGRLQEWIEDFADAEPTHRHISHLIALHPGSEITVRGTPALAAAVNRTLELRGDGGTGWSKAWKVNFRARLEQGDPAYKMFSELVTKSTMPNMFDTHPPFQIDGNFGGLSGMIEMLLQSHVRLAPPSAARNQPEFEIHLLPALPSAWPAGSVSGLKARGGVTVDITWRDGKVERTRLTPSQDGPLQVRIGEQTYRLACKTGKTWVLDGAGKVVGPNGN